MRFFVNGEAHDTTYDEMNYADVLLLALGKLPKSVHSVTYRKGGDSLKPEGILAPGQSVKIKGGTIFYVSHTSNA